ncbi:MAG: FeoA family protein [Anaerolineae bacterium]|nr:FeoA family protein [Anaerolineae bacterium]
MPVRCPMCGYEYDPMDLRCHVSCPLGARCALTCCPQCGYQMPDLERSTSARWFRGLLARLRPTRERSHATLANVLPGQSAVVMDVEEAAGDRLARLAHLGVLPGAVVHVLRRRPVLIVEVEGATLALDPEVAAHIRVSPM